MTQVEKLSISIEATNNVLAGLKSVEDDLAGFKKRTASDRAVELSLRVGALQTAKAEAEQQLKAFKASGDRLGQISVRADIAILKQNLNQANRELTNFARTGNAKVSVLGKLFGGVGRAIGDVGTSVSGMASKVTSGIGGLALKFFALEKAISFVKNSFQTYMEQSGKAAGQEKEVEKIQNAFTRLQYVVGSVVSDAISGFFSLFGKNTEDGINKITAFVNQVAGGFKIIKEASQFLVQSIGAYLGAVPEIAKEAFMAVGDYAKYGFALAKNAANSWMEDWANGVEMMTGGKIDLRGKLGGAIEEVVPPDAGKRIGAILAKVGEKVGTFKAEARADILAVVKDTQKMEQEVKRVKGKNAQAASKAASSAAEAQRKADLESVERVEKMMHENTLKRIEEEKQKREKLKGIYVDVYGAINSELDKAKDKVKELDDKIADLGKKRDEQNKDAAKSLGERYVEIQAAIADIVSGKELADNLGALMKEKAIIEKSTTEADRSAATKYAGLTKAEQIIYDRDIAIAAIDAEKAALQAKRDEELAAVQAVSDTKIKLEKMYTAAMQEEITKQLSAQDQLIAKLQAVERAARAAAAAKASAGAGSAPVTNNNVTVNNDVKNGVDAKIVTNAITSKLSS